MLAMSGIRSIASYQKPLVLIILAATFGLGAAGCVTEAPPTIAHAHIGHAVTGWHDTPEQQGLLVTAAREAEIGYNHAGFALAGRPASSPRRSARRGSRASRGSADRARARSK